MTHSRVVLLTGALLFGSVMGAGAQMILQGPAPGPGMGPGLSPGMGPTFGAPAQQSMSPCLAQFLPMRTEAEKRADVLKAGIKRKVPRPELCELFRHFAEAEAKVVSYATTNEAACSIPKEAVSAMKKNHAQTVEVRDRVCAQATGPQGPGGPNLGEALGQRVPSPDMMKAGTGTLDTLSGNPLGK